MIGVFILDGERSWTDCIKSEFPWKECGCTLLGSMSSADAALSTIIERNPDLILMDLDAPQLELEPFLHGLRRVCPEARVIIETARTDFESALQALNLGASAYLVKPIPMAKLAQAVSIESRRIIEARQTAAAFEKRNRMIRESAAFFRQKMTLVLVNRSIDAREIELVCANMRTLGHSLAAGCYMALEIGSRDLARRQGESWSFEETLMENQDGVELAVCDDGQLCGFVMGDDEADLQRRACALASRTLEIAEKYGFDARIGLGDPVASLEQLPRSASQARARMVSVEQPRGVIGAEQLPLAEGQMRFEPIVDLYSRLRYAAPDDLRAVFDDYMASIHRLGLPEGAVGGFLRVETLLVAARIVQENDGLPEEVLDINAYLNSVKPAEPVNRCVEAACKLLGDVLAYRARLDDTIGNKNIARARFFLDQRYVDPDLMLKDAAREAGMSTSRFSTVFSQETGMTFTEYVTRLRIDKAKELLSRTNMRISQIAMAVGYSDPHYFSWIFRKCEGVTPSGCRDALRQDASPDEGDAQA